MFEAAQPPLLMQVTGTESYFPHRLLPALLATVLLAGPSLSAAEPAKSVASALQPFVDSHTLAGAVTLVASKEQILSLEAVGWADIAASRPMKTDALFWIASQSKPVTATALMMLVDEGKVNVDDPVEKYLPEFNGQWLAVEQDKEHVLLKKPARSIKVRDILSHTSGLPFSSRLESKGDALKIDRLPLREAVISYALTPLNFEPGTKYDYSNAGINTAGRIIEVVSGMPYEEFMARRLFKPLGMTDTTLWPSQKQSGGSLNRTGPTRTRLAWRRHPSTSSRIRSQIATVAPPQPGAFSRRPRTFPFFAA